MSCWGAKSCSNVLRTEKERASKPKLLPHSIFDGGMLGDYRTQQIPPLFSLISTDALCVIDVSMIPCAVSHSLLYLSLFMNKVHRARASALRARGHLLV
jgi:hypothetical protein